MDEGVCYIHPHKLLGLLYLLLERLWEIQDWGSFPILQTVGAYYVIGSFAGTYGWLSIFNITKPITESIEYLLLKILTSYLLVTSCISSYNLERSEILMT